MCVAFAHAAFLDSAQCFALVPVATLLRRTGREDAAQLDFDLDSQRVQLRAGRSYGYALTQSLLSLLTGSNSRSVAFYKAQIEFEFESSPLHSKPLTIYRRCRDPEKGVVSPL